MINTSTAIGSGGTGSYSWMINSTQTLGSDYKIRVTSTINSIYSDTSNNNFSIDELSMGNENRITTNSADQRYADISNNRIVYEDKRDGNIDIYMYDLSTNTEKRITTNSAYQLLPGIDGNRIVWWDMRNVNADVYMYDLSTNTERRITTNTANQTYPAISGNHIVWADYRNGNADIYLYNLSTGTEKRITTNTAKQDVPAISGNRIVWEDMRNGNPDIYMYDLSINTEKRITTNTANQNNPGINGNRIIWYDNRNGNPDIYMYDLSTNTETRITTNTANQLHPSISGNRIVWEDMRNGNADIYMYDLSTNTETQITTNTAGQWFPAISGNRMVWHDARNGNLDIYLYNISIWAPSIISNVQVASGKIYVLDKLANDKLFYIDRTYLFTSVPSSYVGLDYIQTATDDRYITAANFLQFDVNQPVTVYVAYDDRISPKPSWLSSFADTGDNLMRDGSVTFSIYSRAYPSGHVSLIGNSIPSGGVGGMYVVIVKPQGAPLPSTLSVSISESPDPVTSDGTSQVTVHVTSGGSNMIGANVDISVNGGSLSSSSGLTDTNGDFPVTYTAPTVTIPTTYTISATASKTGYTSGSGSDQITVNPISSGLIISNVVASTGKPYVQDTLAIGKLFYIDRTYKFTSVPASYNGLKYIKTATDDRYITAANFLQFDVNQPVTVYVAYDDRISPKPSWLSSFADTGDNLMRDGSVTFSIYSRAYPSGHVSLIGNSIPSGGAGGMYVVIVK